MLCFLVAQVEEFAHINGWEAYPDEDTTSEKPSSKTSSRVSTPIAEVDGKKVEQEPTKIESKAETTTEKKEETDDKSERMDSENVEAGKVPNGIYCFCICISKVFSDKDYKPEVPSHNLCS